MKIEISIGERGPAKTFKDFYSENALKRYGWEFCNYHLITLSENEVDCRLCAVNTKKDYVAVNTKNNYVAVNDDDVLTYVGSHVWSVDHGKSI